MTKSYVPPPITNEELNRLYGSAGRTFSTLPAAEKFAEGKDNARIYPLWDIIAGARCRVAFLVSIEPGYAPSRAPKKFTGKIRRGED
jgi:hypothetical protein